MRFLATIEYDGTNYAGWQIQPNGISIEEEIEKVLFRLMSKTSGALYKNNGFTFIHN